MLVCNVGSEKVERIWLRRLGMQAGPGGFGRQAGLVEVSRLGWGNNWSACFHLPFIRH